jgi:hypothetical protein
MPKRENPSGRLVIGSKNIRVGKSCFSCLLKYQDEKMYGGVEVYLNEFVT